MRGTERSATTLSARLWRAAAAVVGDLNLLVSLCVAHLVVRHTLWRRSRERAARRKLLRLLPGSRGAGENGMTPGGGVRGAERKASDAACAAAPLPRRFIK
jgi:hypothetical protein